jgi:hypothetical protein
MLSSLNLGASLWGGKPPVFKPGVKPFNLLSNQLENPFGCDRSHIDVGGPENVTERLTAGQAESDLIHPLLALGAVAARGDEVAVGNETTKFGMITPTHPLADLQAIVVLQLGDVHRGLVKNYGQS